ncbi:MAG: hypothetical protein JJU42_07770 [Rhodobacteraceae bacterium]|nr:hypothetical protein [Paracoccaceae bacterium]
MRRIVLTLALVAVAGLAAFWAAGGLDMVQARALEAQRAFQNALARALRALHGGEPGALATLWGVAFAYGFLHAVGPGHGKFLLGAYGAGTRVPLGRMMGIGLAASLAQAGTAIALVYGGVALFALSRAQIEAVSDAWMAPLSLIAIAALGLWLVWRGARALLRMQGAPALAAAGAMPAAGGGGQHHHHHHHHQPHDDPCTDCGHRHLPDTSDVARISSLREAALVIGAIALRPCTGALFLLILTWRMGLEWQGVTAALAMGLGTASVTVAVAALAVMARDGALVWSGRIGRMAALVPVVEVLAGALVAGVALMLLGGVWPG